MKSLFTLFTLMVFAVMVFSSSESSHAGPVQWGTPGKKLSGTAITEQVSGVVGDATKASRTISYGIGGLGAVALGALAFFGRFQWGWFFGLIGGLALIGLYNVAAENLAGGGTDLGGLKTSN
jgi:hypothetical protein